MIYYLFIEALLAAFFACLFWSVYKDYGGIKNGVRRLLLLAVLAIVFKSSWGYMFYGLEYEDAYAFAFSARQFSNNIFSSSFLVDGITIGSLDYPVSVGCYGGHFITFPVYLSNFFRLFGYSEGVMAWAQLLTMYFVLVLLSLFDARGRRWMIAPIVYCMAPMMNVFGTSMLGETFSSLVCLSFIYFVANGKSNCFALVAFFLALLCKRENLILLVVPLCFAVKGCVGKRDRNYRSVFLQIVGYVAVCAIYFLCIKNVFSIEALESKDIQASTFSLAYFRQLFPVFGEALLNLKCFGIVCYATVLLLIYQSISRTITTRQVVFGVLYLGYLLLYTSHYRGYGFVHGLEEASEFMSFRYLNNFYYLLALILCDAKLPLSRRLVSMGGGVLLLISIVFTINTRKNLSEEEYLYNFRECSDVANLISEMGSKKYIVLTDRILTYQVTMPPWFNVCDIRNIGNLNPNVRGYDFFIVYQDDFSYLQKRYGVNVDTSRIIKLKQINNNRYLYKYDITAEDISAK